jgi:SAM-dependent methyltransferase
LELAKKLASLACEGEKMRASENEKQKWDKCYASARLLEEDQVTKEFNKELRELFSKLLPPGSNILEAGCGAGRQSLALARLGLYGINLMDFSQEALRYAQRLFDREDLQANFISGDVFEPNKPDYDLVFNAGVLEHYTFDQQVVFLRGMASRSRKYVMVLVPNALCYWYWLWRIQKSGEGKWPFGKEVPATELSRAFGSAGLEFLGQKFVGEGLTKRFIDHLTGLDERLRYHILEVHRSPIIPKSQKSYLVAALGSVIIEKRESLSGWEEISQLEEDGIAEMRAALADALALRINAEQTLRDLRSEVAQLISEKRAAQAIRSSLSFQLGNVLIQAVRKPGRSTALLPYYLARLCIMGFRNRRTIGIGRSNSETRPPKVMSTVR